MIEDIVVNGDFSKKPGEFKPNENQFHLCFQYSKVLEPKYLSLGKKVCTKSSSSREIDHVNGVNL